MKQLIEKKSNTKNMKSLVGVFFFLPPKGKTKVREDRGDVVR